MQNFEGFSLSKVHRTAHRTGYISRFVVALKRTGWKLVYFFTSFRRFSTSFSLPVNFMRQGISRPPCSSGERRFLPMTSTLMVPPLFRKYQATLDTSRGKCPTTLPSFITLKACLSHRKRKSTAA